jgi:H+/Cl- antiporter ClcA
VLTPAEIELNKKKFEAIAKDRISFSDLDNLTRKDNISVKGKRAIEHPVSQSPYKGTVSMSRYNREFYFPTNAADEFEKLSGSYIIAAVVAVAVFAAAIFIDIVVGLVSTTVYSVGQHLLIDESINQNVTSADYGGAFILFVLISGFFVLCSALLVMFVSPSSAGSGIPDVKAYLNGWHVMNLFTVKSLFVKALGTGLTVGSG